MAAFISRHRLRKFPLGLVSVVLPVSMLVITTVSTMVAAQGDSLNPNFPQRFYINAGIGLTQIEPESPSDALTVSDNTDVGAHIGIGYDFNRFLSVEGYVADLGTADIDFLSAPAGTVDYLVYGVSFLGYLYNSQSGFGLFDSDTTGLFRREGLSVFGRAGVGRMNNSAQGVEYVRDYATHAAFGVGLEYGFRNGFALRTELMSMDTDAQYFNVGILKRFGNVPIVASAPLTALVPTVAEPELPATDLTSLAVPAVVSRPPLVYFDFDKSVISAEGMEKLDLFVDEVSDMDSSITVEGHTDWIAPEQYNMSLSIRRAEAVVNYLVSKGISARRISMMGYGELRPISNNNTASGRALNRRVEIRVGE